MIFEDRAEADPEVYWELRPFAKAFNAHIDNFNMPIWWQNQQAMFERNREEFKLASLELRPSRRSAGRKRGHRIDPTLCTSETLLGTKGLLVMLLHWATSFKSKAGRASAHAMLEDLLRQVLSVNHRHRELWDRLAVFRTDDQELADPKIEASIGEIMTPQKPFHEAVTRSVEFLFANRKECRSMKANLIHWLDVLVSHMNKMILNGTVGQENPTAVPTLQFSGAAHEK